MASEEPAPMRSNRELVISDTSSEIVYLVDDTLPTLSSRSYGKSAMQMASIYIEIKSEPLRVEYTYNPLLRMFFVGPILSQIICRSRPSVNRRHHVRHDQKVNKRKSWMKQMLN